MKNLLEKTSLFVSMVLIVLLIFSGCRRRSGIIVGTDGLIVNQGNGQEEGQDGQEGDTGEHESKDDSTHHFTAEIFIPQAAENNILKDTLDDETDQFSVKLNAKLSGDSTISRDIAVHFTINPDLVNSYNSEHSTSYKLLPEDNYELEDGEVAILTGDTESAKVEIKINSDLNNLDRGTYYILPISLSTEKPWVGVKKDKEHIYLLVMNLMTKPIGTGTESNPYKIYTLENLEWVSDHSSKWDASYTQEKDIDASDTKNWNNGEGFVPIGNSIWKFNGTYDGGGHSIKNLHINRNKMYMGLFGYTDENAVIKNLEMKGVDIQGGGDSGPVIGLSYGEVNNVKVLSGSINCDDGGNGGDNIGGIVGSNYGNILNCESAADVTGVGNNIGGISGWSNKNTLVKNCHATGDVAGNGYTGGLIGSTHGDVDGCSASGKVQSLTGDQYIGGLIGIVLDQGNITNSHATGDVFGGTTTGGLIGDLHGIVDHCYATGKITGEGSNTGGLIGYVTERASVIRNSHAEGEVINHGGYTGGLIGYAKEITAIENCYATGNVTENEGTSSGGLIGRTRKIDKIKNCHATGTVTIKKGGNLGGLIGYMNEHAPVENCYATGDVINNGGQTGGLIGYTNGDKTIVKNSYATGKVTNHNLSGNTSSYHCGGLIGYANTSTGLVNNCYATGNINNTNGMAGGFIGYDKNVDVEECFSTGDAATLSNNFAGGFIGDIHANVTNCYSTGNATSGGTKNTGGFIGQYWTKKITNCYSTGKASNSNGTAQGFAYQNTTGTATNCYWDVDVSGLSNSGFGTGLNTSDMQGSAAESNMTGFKFTSVWETNSGGYPTLRNTHP